MPEEKKVTGAVAKGENFWLEAAERAWFESHVCKCKKKKKKDMQPDYSCTFDND